MLFVYYRDDFKPVVRLSSQDILDIPLTHTNWICYEEILFFGSIDPFQWDILA